MAVLCGYFWTAKMGKEFEDIGRIILEARKPESQVLMEMIFMEAGGESGEKSRAGSPTCSGTCFPQQCNDNDNDNSTRYTTTECSGA